MKKSLSRRTFLRTSAVAGAAVAVAPIAAAAGAAPAKAGAAAATAAGASRDYVSLVDPWVQSDISRWYFFQSASNPFGFIKLRPDTNNSGAYANSGGGCRPGQPDVQGFTHLHDWGLAGVQVMPTSGPSVPVPKTQGEAGWQSPRVHANEVAQPGYHKVHLDAYGITAELTCTDRVGLHRYTYDNAGPSEIIINLGGVLGEAVMISGQVTMVSNKEIEGYVVQHANQTFGAFFTSTLYFSIRFDRPFDSLRGWADGSLANGGGPISSLAGSNMGVYARYEQVNAGEVIQMTVGLSFTGTDGARSNLDAEAPGFDFDGAKTQSQQLWNDMLGRIDVQGGTQQQQIKFYTDLFHVLCGRSLISDADGKYLDNTWGIDQVRQIPLDSHGTPTFAMYNHDALWLTQWNLNSVLGLAYPEVYSSFVHCHLEYYQNGGLLPRGPAAGNYSMIMTSAPVTSFICGAWNKGIRDFDIDLAYAAMLDAQSLGGLFDKEIQAYASWSGSAGESQYLDLGYVAIDEAYLGDGGAGRTLEYAYQDWTLAQLARQLGKQGLNVSQFAQVSVSSQLNDDSYAGVRAVDGRPIRAGGAPDGQNVEWASAGETTPWIRLAWAAPQTVHTVVLSDRADPAVNVNSGVLSFSDGSSLQVSGVPADGSNKVVQFPAKTITWVQFDATGGTGVNVGLNEIEVWDDTDTYGYLLGRSRNWRNLFDPTTGFIRPRSADGTFLDPFDPLAPTDFVEANSWQASWFTVHDVMGQANLLGSRSTYASKLNYAFVSTAPYDFAGNGGGPEFIYYGNQPDLEVAQLFNYVGYPWLSQYWTRQVQQQTFGSIATTAGYGWNDEDQGQMGSISALMAMGLFEVTGGGLARPVYDITSPIFDQITITLNPAYYPGQTFRIITHNNSAASTYIQSATLNGAPLGNAFFYHDQLTAGGTLELWLGDQPNKNWGTAVLPPSESPSNGQQPVNATAITITGPDTIQWPYRWPFTADFSPQDTSLKLVFWSVTAPDGSPTDIATIDYTGTLAANALTGDVLVTATAADEGGVTSSKAVSIGTVPGASDANQLASAFNNIGISDDSAPTLGNFDGDGNSYSAEALAAAGITPGGTVTSGGVTFTWPDVAPGSNDNVITNGQIVSVPGSGSTLGFLGTAVNTAATVSGTIFYTDGSSQPYTISYVNWTNGTPPAGGTVVAKTTYLNTLTGQLTRNRYLYGSFVTLQAGKTVAAVQLPPAAGSGDTGIHIFAIAVG